MRLLIVNAGSSTLKLRLLDDDDTLVATEDLGRVDELAEGELATALSRLTGGDLATVDAVGHRVVHGGAQFTSAVRIDEHVTEELAALTDLAPLHQPVALAALAAVSRELPGLPAVACFDTAFHTTLPAAASTYPVPQAWRQKHGLRRYGFHGLSHASCARRSAQLLGRPQQGLHLVSCHLGAGASLAAIVDGRSVDTTMGFTPNDGLVMATRCGSLDPGLVLWLLEHERLSHEELSDALEHRSGLYALAGSGDMREVEQAADAGDVAAGLALDVFVHRLVTSIGAMAVAAGGLDALAFTGGVGEHSATVRLLAAARLRHLGVELDASRNHAVDSDADVSARGAPVRTLVVTAREDLQMAREIRALLDC